MNAEELNFENETRKHQQRVCALLTAVAQQIMSRAITHDDSKLKDPERQLFIEATASLRGLTYGSPEYNESLKKLEPALYYHYANNKHHPEYNDIRCHTTVNGPVAAMDLIDIIEMLCDWIAATERHADGCIGKSISINQKRFFIDDQLTQILRNTSAIIKGF